MKGGARFRHGGLLGGAFRVIRRKGSANRLLDGRGDELPQGGLVLLRQHAIQRSHACSKATQSKRTAVVSEEWRYEQGMGKKLVGNPGIIVGRNQLALNTKC